MKLILASLVLLFILPFTILAADYGYGTFGEGNFSEGSHQPLSISSILGSTTNAPVCNEQTPGIKPPWIYGAVAKDGNSIELYFTEADNPVNKYVLEYGTQSGQYQYGVSDMGVNERQQMTYTVNLLGPNTTYYFRIRGGNGCAPGPWSNELSVSTKGLIAQNQLDMTTSVSISGDTTQSETAEGTKSTSEADDDSIKDQEATTALEGYDIRIKVVDTSKKPVKDAAVTLHSTPRSTTTDVNGIASFSDVEPGAHKVLIAYRDYEGEQSLNVGGNSKEINLNITIEPKNTVFSSVSLAIITLLLLLVAGLVVWTVVLKRKKSSINRL